MQGHLPTRACASPFQAVEDAAAAGGFSQAVGHCWPRSAPGDIGPHYCSQGLAAAGARAAARRGGAADPAGSGREGQTKETGRPESGGGGWRS